MVAMPSRLAAVCFDLDGLLVDTEGYYYEVHRSILAEHGITMSLEAYARTWIIRGTHWADEVRRHGLAADPAQLAEESRRRFRALVEKELRLMPHARETLAA